MDCLLNVERKKEVIMRSKLYLLVFSTIALGALSCKTASKLYEKGNYTAAVELAAKKLQKDPEDPKLRDIIRQSYRFAVRDHENRVRQLSESSDELKWERIYYEYLSLQRMHDAIFRVPAVFNEVQPEDFTSYLQTYASRAGDVRLERGQAFMQRYDKKSYQAAYREFEAALQFKPGDREVLQKREEAFEYAVTNVVVLPLQQYGGYVYSGYAPGADNLDDRIIRRLQNGAGGEFVRYYSAWEARSSRVRTDQVVEMQLADFRIGRMNEYVNTRKVSRDVLVKETVIRPDSVVREYANVKAAIQDIRRSLASRASVQLVIRDGNDHWLWSQHLSAHHNWANTFSTYTGDNRALSEEDRQLVARRPEPAPSEWDIMQCLTDQLVEEAFSQIRNYSARF